MATNMTFMDYINNPQRRRDYYDMSKEMSPAPMPPVPMGPVERPVFSSLKQVSAALDNPYPSRPVTAVDISDIPSPMSMPTSQTEQAIAKTAKRGDNIMQQVGINPNSPALSPVMQRMMNPVSPDPTLMSYANRTRQQGQDLISKANKARQARPLLRKFLPLLNQNLSRQEQGYLSSAQQAYANEADLVKNAIKIEADRTGQFAPFINAVNSMASTQSPTTGQLMGLPNPRLQAQQGTTSLINSLNTADANMEAGFNRLLASDLAPEVKFGIASGNARTQEQKALASSVFSTEIANQIKVGIAAGGQKDTDVLSSTFGNLQTLQKAVDSGAFVGNPIDTVQAIVDAIAPGGADKTIKVTVGNTVAEAEKNEAFRMARDAIVNLTDKEPEDVSEYLLDTINPQRGN